MNQSRIEGEIKKFLECFNCNDPLRFVYTLVYHFLQGVLLSWGIKVKMAKTCFHINLCSFLTTDPCGFLCMVQMLFLLPKFTSLESED